jgi:hypothetical protein
MYDPMHVFDHGLIAHMLRYMIKLWMRFEARAGLTRWTIVRKLLDRLRSLIGYFRGPQEQVWHRHHMNLLCLPNTVVKMFKNLAGMSEEGKKKSCPIVDANDMQRLATAMPFLMEDLTRHEVLAYNTSLRFKRDWLTDPTPGFVSVFELFLEMYSNYRWCI